MRTNPPHYYKNYKSNLSRSPKKTIPVIKYNKEEISEQRINVKNFKHKNNLLEFRKKKHPIGQKIIVYGQVTNLKGEGLKNIIIEIWQANASGKYRDFNDKHDAPLDPYFQGYGITLTDRNGNYKFFTIMPGAYPWQNHKNAWRPKHIHFSLLDTNFFSRLCTQMYFPDDILLKNDPIFMAVPSKFRNKLIAKYNNEHNNTPNFITYNFDITMP